MVKFEGKMARVEFATIVENLPDWECCLLVGSQYVHVLVLLALRAFMAPKGCSSGRLGNLVWEFQYDALPADSPLW